jgi:hypothetical protein
MVSRIATGEVEETSKPKSGRTYSGHAGAKARAKSLSCGIKSNQTPGQARGLAWEAAESASPQSLELKLPA